MTLVDSQLSKLMHACAAQHFQQLPSYISMLWNPQVIFGASLMGRVIRECRGNKVCIFPYSPCRLQRESDGLQYGQQHTSHSQTNIPQAPHITSLNISCDSVSFSLSLSRGPSGATSLVEAPLLDSWSRDLHNYQALLCVTVNKSEEKANRS